MMKAERAGRLEVARTPITEARVYADKEFRFYRDVGLHKALPAFDNNFRMAQALSQHGHFFRHEMPVIEEEDFAQIEKLNLRISPMAVLARNMIPLQKQIYLEHSVEPTAKAGIRKTTQHILAGHIFLAQGGHILDGHHRWLSAMIMNPNLVCRAYLIDEDPALARLKLLALSDAENHPRNL